MKQIRIILLLITLTLTSLACNLGGRLLEKPRETIPVTTEAVEGLMGKVKKLESLVQSGDVVELIITETEITSLVVFELMDQSPQPLDNIQIYLRDGQIQVFGTYRESGLSLPLEVVATPIVSAVGVLSISLDTVKIGPVAAPDVLQKQAQSLVDEVVLRAVNDRAGESFIVNNVSISDGQMIINGLIP